MLTGVSKLNNTQIFCAAVEIWAAYDHESQLLVQGTSMAPLIQPGDRVGITHRFDRPKTGDILVYHTENLIVLHRFCGWTAKGVLRMAGDNHPYPDPPVPNHAILGRVTSVCAQPTAPYSLTNRRAVIWGKFLAKSLPVRRLPGFQRLLAPLSRLAAQIIRR